MSLTKCPECGKEISDKATVCPNCGTPFGEKKFCKFCGEAIDNDCVVCPRCGKQVEDIGNKNGQNIIINNNNSASASATATATVTHNVVYGKPKNKWVSLLLCICTLCGHKFYEGKIGMGIVYLFTAGLFGIGWIIDIITLALKPNPYYV